jgi:hypothetical protein
MCIEDLNPAVTNVIKLKEGIESWNRVAGIPFFTYRQRLKEIASQSWNHYPIATDPRSISDDDWLIPTDDDDWILSGIEFPKQAEYIHWKTLVYQTVRTSSTYVTGEQDNFPQSNAYAIKGSMIKRMSPHLLIRMLTEHQKSLKIARRHGHVEFIPSTLSAYNLHPGCAHVLKSNRRESSVLSLFPKTEPLIELEHYWVRPYASKFYKVLEEARGG